MTRAHTILFPVLYASVALVIAFMCVPFSAQASSYAQATYWCGSYWSYTPCYGNYYGNTYPYHQSYPRTYPVSQTTWTTCYGVSSTGHPYTYACQQYPQYYNYHQYNQNYYGYQGYNAYNYTYTYPPQYYYRHW